MHEPEKSDSVVVAGKPANKAERFAAEPVEPRTEAKGNAGQQSTRRAQDRASVSQALERVRQAARRGKRERVTSLLHHVDPAMLRTAFYAMKRRSEEHTSELQSPDHLVCRLLLEKKKKTQNHRNHNI